MEPMLGMRYESPHQLKLALANYGVAHGFQLWYMKNDWRNVLVYYGRNVVEGRCAGKKVIKIGEPKKKKSKKDVFTVYFRYDKIFFPCSLKDVQGEIKKVNDSNFDETCYEKLLQIMKRLVPHGCCKRVYYCKTGAKLSVGIREIKSNQDIVEMLTVGYENGNIIDMYVEHFDYDVMEIRHDTNETPKVDPDDNQIDHVYKCQRAKQLALFDHVGGIIEHFGRLYEYMRAILDSNSESTWCRNVIGLDGFLKHTCRGELLTAMGRDANTQMYPIAWVVVRDENTEIGGLLDVVNDLLPESGLSFQVVSKSWKLERKKHVVVGQCASKGGRSYGQGNGSGGSGSVMGSSGVSGGIGDGSGGNDNRMGSSGGIGDGSDGRGGGTSSKGGGRGRRGGGMAGRGGGRGSRDGGSRRGGEMAGSSSRGAKTITSDKKYQLKLDKEAFREVMEEQAIVQVKIDAEQERLDKERRHEQ
nr:F-box domain, leucine-rich repeat domain, L domain-like protein [Tanacetum cinerariifolium]